MTLVAKIQKLEIMTPKVTRLNENLKKELGSKE